MPGGSWESYDALGPILEDISAHVGDEPCCTEAVFARATSSHRELREHAQAALDGPDRTITDVGDAASRQQVIDDIRDALWASKVVAYAQGLDEIRTASQEYGWDINVAEVAKIWRAGCIIRAKLLERIRSECAAGDLVTLLEAPSVKSELARCQNAWRRVVCRAITAGVPVPGFAAALAYYDSIRAPRVNAALTQGLRDFFGAHTYNRIDADGTFHTLWSGDRTEIKVN
jgi:6-phosphogluconate dehydrogenase